MVATNTRSQILDAVLDTAGRDGLNGLSVEGVAERAGVSRQTVYRHFESRQRLIEQAIVREERVFIAHMLASADGEDTLAGAVEAAVTAALSLARAHPVLTQVLEREPEGLLPYLLLGRGPVISAAEPAVQDLVRLYHPDLPSERLRLVADVATRLLVSYVVSPNAAVADDVLAHELAGVVVHLVER